MNDYTLVLGVDRYHLAQLAWTFPTWARHKPSVINRQVVVFYDRDEVSERDVRHVVRSDYDEFTLQCIPWPAVGIRYRGVSGDKWNDPQRYKMLAGFVHVSAENVSSRYWLKVDTDVVATGNDNWVDPEWFMDSPGIVAHPWGFTKPPDQMLRLDEWAQGYYSTAPLHLVPKEGADRIRHSRIISWCGFFATKMTQELSRLCNRTCGDHKLPVPSQDGVCWYHCTRSGLPIIRPRMKGLGWQHWSTMANVEKYSKLAMK